MKEKRSFIVILFLLGRLIFLSTQPLEGLRGYGDFIHYFQLNFLGIPYLDFWSEFPPVFPFLSWIMYQLSAGQQHTYEYLLILILTLAQAGSLWIVMLLLERFYPSEATDKRVWLYFVVLLAVPYGWWYFDALVVFVMLLGLTWLLESRVARAGAAIALGVLCKLFPVMLLPLLIRRFTRKQALLAGTLALGITLVVYFTLFLQSPEMTIASIRSQGSKGSWETIWALVDGNFMTGNFGPEIERIDPAKAMQLQGNPARVPAWLTLIIFGGIGLWVLLRARLEDSVRTTAFFGVTWCLFLFWTPGYSPQWVQYLFPLVILVLPQRKGFMFVFALVFINLLEWPILLTRGYNWGLWFTIPIRMVLLGVLFLEFYRMILMGETHPGVREEYWIPEGHP